MTTSKRPLPQVGEIWLRKSDRGTTPLRVRVLGLTTSHPTRVLWELEHDRWGAVRRGSALLPGWYRYYSLVEPVS